MFFYPSPYTSHTSRYTDRSTPGAFPFSAPPPHHQGSSISAFQLLLHCPTGPSSFPLLSQPAFLHRKKPTASKRKPTFSMFACVFLFNNINLSLFPCIKLSWLLPVPVE